MVKVLQFTRLFLLILTITPVLLSAQPEKQVIYKLQDGEVLMYGENWFSLTGDKNDVFFVTKQNGKFFTNENGTRKGPFDAMTEDMLKGSGDNPNKLCARFNLNDCNNNTDISKYVLTDDSYKSIIKFNEKKYGPFMAVAQFYLTCSGSGFLAVILTEENKQKIVTSDGKILELPGSFEWVLLSPDGKQGLIGLGMLIDPAKIDMNNINMAELNKFSVIDLNGTVIGNFDRTKNTSGDFWFCISGGNHWFMKKNDVGLLRDGQAYKNLPSGYGDCDLWISEDGKHIGVVDYGQGEFTETADIFKIKSPLQLNSYQKDGKTWLKWISLENDKEIVLYKRSF